MSEKKNQPYENIREIIENSAECRVTERRRGLFKFPMYLTEKMEEQSIEVLDLTQRSNNCLRRTGINTIGELCDRIRTSSDLKHIRNCGDRSVAEIMDKLFLYQYEHLSESRKVKFIKEVISLNI